MNPLPMPGRMVVLTDPTDEWEGFYAEIVSTSDRGGWMVRVGPDVFLDRIASEFEVVSSDARE